MTSSFVRELEEKIAELEQELVWERQGRLRHEDLESRWRQRASELEEQLLRERGLKTKRDEIRKS